MPRTTRRNTESETPSAIAARKALFAIPTSELTSDGYLAFQIDKAKELEAYKRDLFEAITANRDALRNAVKTGFATGDVADWIGQAYPVKRMGQNSDAPESAE